MNITALIIISIVGLLALLLIAIGLGFPVLGSRGSSKASMEGHLRSIVQAQRTTVRGYKSDKQQASIMDVAAKEGRVGNLSTSRRNLSKKLRYARWKITPTIFRVLVVVVSLIALSISNIFFNIVLQLISLTAGPILMGYLLNSAIRRRFSAFDHDYPSFLLSLVGLLKTGMNALTGLEAAAEGLEPNSLVRQEVQAMLERLRIGITEDQSIGAFGEDIDHEEIELFVQALLLSRRVGGNLSDTLERLAKQVRKRQYFRQLAHAAVGMQRGSIWVILGILIFIMFYLYFVAPELVTVALNDDFGWQVWQFGITVILLGMYWITQVTKIRI